MLVCHLHVLSIPFDNDYQLSDRKDQYENKSAKSKQQSHEKSDKNNILHHIQPNEKIVIAMPTNKYEILLNVSLIFY